MNNIQRMTGMATTAVITRRVRLEGFGLPVWFIAGSKLFSTERARTEMPVFCDA